MNDYWMEDFTEEERCIINDLHQREFQGMTADEVALYARWESAKAVFDESLQAELASITATCTARINAMEEQRDIAIANLEAQKDAAIAWYESVIGGDDNG